MDFVIRSGMLKFTTIFAAQTKPQGMVKKSCMMRLIFLVPLLFLFGKTPAQLSATPGEQTQTPEIFQRLQITQDPGLAKMVEWHIRKNEATRGINGFRVEIFFSSALNARQQAQQIRTNVLRDYPGVSVYLLYVSPDFKVRLGDFRTRNEALELMHRVSGQFPKAFVVRDLIEFPNLH